MFNSVENKSIVKRYRTVTFSKIEFNQQNKILQIEITRFSISNNQLKRRLIFYPKETMNQEITYGKMSFNGSNRTKILVFNIGGTITMKETANGRINVEGYFAKIFFDRYRKDDELSYKNISLTYKESPKMIDSSLATFKNYCDILKFVEENYQSYERFIILYGSDTITHAACFFHHAIKNQSKPIVFVCKQNPIDHTSVNDWENLEKCFTFNNIGTYISVEGKFYLPMYLTKFNTISPESFMYNDPLKLNVSSEKRQITNATTEFNYNYVDEIGVLKITPTMKCKTMKYFLETFKVVVFIGYGSTTILYDRDILQLLAENKTPIVMITNCIIGGTSHDYASINILKERFIFAGNHNLASVETSLSFCIINGSLNVEKFLYSIK